MGERKGVNKYYPPDWTPKMGNLNKYHGTHALRERARKIHEGIIIVRFEMPYNIWCNGCGSHIGMGVRYNAQKRKVGNYYTTPIYKFRMKCHLCDQYFEIQTDPQNCDYVILSGAKRKEERWDPAVTENVQTTDRDVKQKLVQDAMFKLEHDIIDKQKAVKVAPTLSRLEDIRDTWKDDYAVNQILREKFRGEKQEINKEKAKADELKEKSCLPSNLELLPETKEDVRLAKKIRYGNSNLRPDIARRHQRNAIKQSSIFGSATDSKAALAKKLSGVTHQKSKNVEPIIKSELKNLSSLIRINKRHSQDEENWNSGSQDEENAATVVTTGIIPSESYSNANNGVMEIEESGKIPSDPVVSFHTTVAGEESDSKHCNITMSRGLEILEKGDDENTTEAGTSQSSSLQNLLSAYSDSDSSD